MRFHRVGREFGDVELQNLVTRQRVVIERIPGVARLVEVALVEGGRIDDNRPAHLQVLQLHGERGGVHGDQDVDRVAGRHHVGAAELDLVGGDAERRAGGCPDLRGKIRERREVAAGERGLLRELAAGDLHPVARISREANHDGVAGFASGPAGNGGSDHAGNLHEVPHDEPHVRRPFGKPSHIPGEPGAAVADQDTDPGPHPR